MLTESAKQDIYSSFIAGEEISAIAHRHGIAKAHAYRTAQKAGAVRPPMFTAEQEQEIVRRYQGGESSVLLADVFRCSPRTLRKVVERHGGSIANRGQRARVLTTDEVAQIVTMYDLGQSQETIARVLGTSQARVSRTLRIQGRGGHRNGGMYKGGRISVNGYVHILTPTDSPFASMSNSSGYIPEHRLVMAKALGRVLSRQETVHHVNGDRADNRISNLQLRTGNHGKGAAFRCLDCGSSNVQAVPLD